jgi:two-component system, OmpR family, sensor histidine kinase KdpD
VVKAFPPLLKHLSAVLITLLTTALLFLFRDLLNTSTVALIYLIPVLISTTLWGLTPGLVSGFTAFLALNYYFLLPYYTFAVLHTQDLTGLAIFFLVAALTSQLVGRARKNLQAAQAREFEATRLYELSVRLVGVNSLPEIAQVLVSQVQESFRAEFVRVSIGASPIENPFSVIVPSDQALPPAQPDIVIPIQAAHRLLGELHLWRESPLNGSEKQMLQTFTTQTALALERATFLQAETRAQVLEESDRMKSALLSSVSHEFRTPLATIKASITSLLSREVEWDDPMVRDELLAVVDEESDQLNRLVGNLLDMSRLEAGALKPDRQWNVLAEIVEGAAARMHRVLETHPLILDLPDDLPLIPVDYFQIERVFTNLISNSIKYAPEGTDIQIRARVPTPHILSVRVTNQGPPVPSEQLPRIFDKFNRVTNADRVTGTGLGLSICKGIVEAHGGQIWAENLSDGFAFCFDLPLDWNGRPPPILEAETP